MRDAGADVVLGSMAELLNVIERTSAVSRTDAEAVTADGPSWRYELPLEPWRAAHAASAPPAAASS
jgi:hypothetical protein